MRERMSKQNDVHCTHLMSNIYCNAVVNDEGKRVREESCSNELKNLCCYLCSSREICEISCVFLDKAPPEVANVVILEEGEKILKSWAGDVEKIAKVITRQGAYIPTFGVAEVKEREYGTLLLTNRRLIWVSQRGNSRNLEFEIPLELIRGISSEEKGSSVRDTKMEYRFRFYRATNENFSALVKTEIQKRKKEIEEEKKRERVQVVMDFSFVNDYIAKGGLRLQTVKCPECGGRLKLPESGKQTVCEHCGNTVYAEDILQRIKDLIG